jgi:hypothetical protein
MFNGIFKKLLSNDFMIELFPLMRQLLDADRERERESYLFFFSVTLQPSATR